MIHPSVGARRRRLVLETPVDEPDGFGGTYRRWVAGPVVWGAITRTGEETRVTNGHGEGVATHRIGLRFRPGIQPGMRLAAGPRRFAIRGAGDPDGRRRDLVCEVEELGPEGTA